ncbi:MAG: hypothetical protein ACJ72M_12320 [Propionibacteriaceae bacterium]
MPCPAKHAVLDERTVAYLDLTGSGAGTVAHLRDDDRITRMYCTFPGAPRILRLYGHGRTAATRGKFVWLHPLRETRQQLLLAGTELAERGRVSQADDVMFLTLS